MSKKQKHEAINAWNKEDKKHQDARKERGISSVPENEVEDYNKILAQAKEKYSIPAAPAMPVNPAAMLSTDYPDAPSSGGKPHADERAHQEHWSEPGFVSNEWFALVNTPIPISKALKMPKAKEALDAEWKKL